MLLPIVGNRPSPDNNIVAEATQVLQGRLPEGWETRIVKPTKRGATLAAAIDAILKIRGRGAPAGEATRREWYLRGRYIGIYYVSPGGDLFMKAQMVRWGNSLAVRIPKPVVEKARLKEGDSLEVEAAAEGLVELRRPAKVPTLAQLVSQITPENRYGEILTGSEVGKEVVEW